MSRVALHKNDWHRNGKNKSRSARIACRQKMCVLYSVCDVPVWLLLQSQRRGRILRSFNRLATARAVWFGSSRYARNQSQTERFNSLFTLFTGLRKASPTIIRCQDLILIRKTNKSERKNKEIDYRFSQKKKLNHNSHIACYTNHQQWWLRVLVLLRTYVAQM